MLVEEDSNENIFELQHHHLLRCLEKTTVRLKMKNIEKLKLFFQDREFVDMDLPFNGNLIDIQLT